MKQVKYSVLLVFAALALVLSSCKPDLSGLESRLDKLEKWQSETKTSMEKVNQDIQSLRKLVEAEQKRLYVVHKTDLPDGYELSMSDGSKITLKNGSSVSVKADKDGKLYWALNGDFLTVGKEGRKLLAEGQPGAPGQPGANGLTPILKVDGEGNWIVSTDGGKKFEPVLTPEGKPVPAKIIEREVSDLKIAQDGDKISITYKGQTFVLPVVPSEKPKTLIPLAYVAEYDINAAGDGFTTDHANGSAGLFNWFVTTGTKDETHNPDGRSLITAPAFAGYHVPTYYEMGLIGPEDVIDADGDLLVSDHAEKVTIGGETLDFTADYFNGRAMTDVVAIRFRGQGNKYLCAYRYQRVTNPEGGNGKDLKPYMTKVTARYLGPKGADVTIMGLRNNEAFWSDPDAEYVTRVFPCSGYGEAKAPSLRKSLGDKGYYWCATLHKDVPGAGEAPGYAIGYKFFDTRFDATHNAYDDPSDLYAVRLIKDKL